jgi:hypothetical protein
MSIRVGCDARAAGTPNGASSERRPFPRLPWSGLRWLRHIVNGDGLRQDTATTGPRVLLLRAVAKGEPTARLARELGLSCKQLHTLRQRIQAHLNATAPTGMMTGTAFEADERYQNAGEQKYAPS